MDRAIIFDIGGVLAADVWEHLLLDDNGVRSTFPNLDKDELKRIGKVLWEAFAYTPETAAANWQELEKRYWKMFIGYFKEQLPKNIDPEVFIQMTDAFIRPVTGMFSVLERIQLNGVNLAICSNNNEFWFRRQMNQYGLRRFFSPGKIVLSCRVGFSKSSPGYEMFHAVVDALGVIPAQCIFIDDKESNVERAQVCGMEGILFSDAVYLADQI